MRTYFGEGNTKFGPGVQIDLTGEEVATAISAYLVAHGVHVDGARTITVNGNRCVSGGIYVDPSGSVIDKKGIGYSGKGHKY